MLKIINDFPKRSIEITGKKDDYFSTLCSFEDVKVDDEIQISVNILSKPRHLIEFGGTIKDIKEKTINENDCDIRKIIVLE